MLLTLDPSSSVFHETLGIARSNKRLQGRKILVVGAGQRKVIDEDSPIGNWRAIATLFAREGAAVVCLDINKEAAEAAVEQIKSKGGTAYPYIFDVRETKSIATAVDDARTLLGGGTWTRWYWWSHMLFAQRALQIMDTGASIVIISSMAGEWAGTGNPAYETSKAAQVALARAIAKIGEPKGIRANVIAPGYVDTPMGRDASRLSKGRAYKVPFGGQVTGWEVAYLALFLPSHESSYISGTTINMDAGSISGTEGRVRKMGEDHKGTLYLENIGKVAC